MTIELNCPECGKAYKLTDGLAGKKARCKACNAVMSVPKQDDVDDFADLADDDVEDYDDAPPPRRRSTRSSRDEDAPISKKKSGKKSKKSARKSVFASSWLWIGGGSMLCVVLCCSLLPGIMQLETVKRTGIDPSKQVAFGAPDSLFPVAQIPVPPFPELGTPQVLQPSGVRVYFIQLLQQRGTAPGCGMAMRVYLPPGDVAPKSIPCVLVAPAGTRLIHGNDLDDADYHAETLPYAEAGMAVIFYSIDGPIANFETVRDAELEVAYNQFRASMAGVVNGRNALEFALDKLPQVDPRRIYSAGHSSAGTLSLLFAAHEPRLAACVAFASTFDVEQRLAPTANNAAVQRVMRDIKSFLKQSSPKTHAAKIGCPVFLFHALDDGIVLAGESQAFAQQLKTAGKTVELKLVATGNHYKSMVNEGVPAAIGWFRGLAPVPAANPAPAP